jgi:hypothetical protein
MNINFLTLLAGRNLVQLPEALAQEVACNQLPFLGKQPPLRSELLLLRLEKYQKLLLAWLPPLWRRTLPDRGDPALGPARTSNLPNVLHIL